MASDIDLFNKSVEENIKNLGNSKEMQELGVSFLEETGKFNYTYNFSWMGLPIIQCPQDIVAMQEILWRIKPDTIIETGIARGGSIAFYSSMMDMMGIADGKVIGIDIDIRAHNREALENHPTAKRIHLVEGSSIDRKTVEQVTELTKGSKTTLVCLDSMHTKEHVLEELRLYADLVSSGSYLVVFDTTIEYVPDSFYPDRPWGPGNSPMTAIEEFLKENSDFEIDYAISDKLLITVARNGFLRKK